MLRSLQYRSQSPQHKQISLLRILRVQSNPKPLAPLWSAERSAKGYISGKKTHLNIERGIETHLKVPLIILIEDAKETLFENRCCERVGKNDSSVRGTWKGLHFQQTDLVKTTGE